MSQTDRVLGLLGHTGIKQPARVATTANIVLSGLQTIDGVVVVADDRVLVKNQTTASENGIWVADTGAWERAKDFNGAYDIVSGTMVRVNAGTQNADGLFVVTTADPITIGTTSLTFGRLAVSFLQSASLTAAAAQTLFNLGISYQISSNNLQVYVNGLHQRVGADYTETSSSSITFTYALQLNDEVDVYAGSALGSLTAAAASAVAITDSGDFYLAVTVEAALQEIAAGITADVGNLDATFTNGSTNRILRWNTALTANRTLTLSTANAKEGAWVTAVRGAGATGNFTLAVGALATLRAPGEWATCRYDAGTGAWVLAAYGFLPSAEVHTVGADVGDLAATLTVGTSARTQRWASALTAERAVSLDPTGAWAGARFTVVRMETATGGFALTVQVGSTVLARLAPGQWGTFEYTGSTWITTATGELRTGLSALITLRDDFLGDEIAGFHWQTMVGSDAECRNFTVLADQPGGMLRGTTGDDVGATMAINGIQLHSHLNWRADRGCLVWEGRVKMSAITAVAVFVGLTDQRSALEMPFTLGAGDVLTSNASDAVGVLFDTGADTDNWWLVGVAADVDAVKQNTAGAPVADTFETWRIEVGATGIATFYRNGVVIGATMNGSLTPATPLTPVVAAFARGAASRTVEVDELIVQAMR